MLVQFLYGPKASLREHVSREVGAVLLAAGFAVQCDPSVPHPQNIPPAYPPKSFTVVKTLDMTNFVIREHDGRGGFVDHEVDPKTRKLCGFSRWDGAQQKRVLVVPDCPQEVLAEWFALSGLPKEAELLRKQIEKANREMQAQNSAGLIGRGK
jgi:hypothetical protein